MNLFRDMDLYKGIVLASLVVLPLGGWLVKVQDEEIAACKKTIHDATKPGGLLEQIGALQRKVEVVVANKRSTSDAIKDPRTYMEGQILAAAGGPGAGLKTTDFQPSEPKEERLVLPSKQPVTDHVVDITWLRKDLTIGMDFLWAVLWNCESGARQVGDQPQQSVWKLRELQLVNATDERALSQFKTPPPELVDKWSIKAMKFARREPRKT
jgi:hypothetical protein